ncbi:hypothetical protein [Tepidibacter aestuarii]|nr:hypothetical protein [Tepidibacter aestuarii]CAH2215316.1 protein of unknown function [Tepidibacter aestuarii]
MGLIIAILVLLLLVFIGFLIDLNSDIKYIKNKINKIENFIDDIDRNEK